MCKDSLKTNEWYMAAYASEGVPTSHHLKLRTVTLSFAADSIPDGHLAVEILAISVDPYLRTRMSGIKDGLDMPPIDLDQTINTLAIGKVIHSKDNKYKEGDKVASFAFPVGEYCVIPSAAVLIKIDIVEENRLLDYLCFGVAGFAAWVGIEVIGDPKPGSNVFISAAAGGVGMLAGQLAKLRGCRVIGSVGSEEKVELLKEEFGYDEVFNYKKETDYDAALSKYVPNGIDVYLDNVGGEMLETVLNHVNHSARIPLCGMISQYNKDWAERYGIRNVFNMVGKEIRMEGFMIGSHMGRFSEFIKEMEGHVAQGKIHCRYEIFNGIGSFLDGFSSMFSSSNVGKVIIQLK